jgi:hypothetical protein
LNLLLKNPNFSTLLAALAAALGYGCWAGYANYEHGQSAWVMAAGVQGAYAFLSTLSISHVAHRTFLRHNRGIRGILVGFGMSFALMLAIPIVVHHLAGTPDIWQTILPGLIWGSIYLLGFLVSLEFTEQE